MIVGECWETKPGGLLFEFADDEMDFKMEKCFFKVEDTYVILSSLSFGDEELARSKEVYCIEPFV